MNQNVDGAFSSALATLNDEQRRAVVHEGSPLLILAGAGSGKTRVITTKIAWLIAQKGVAPQEILAVTFTNKAAREMAERAAALNPFAGLAVIKTFHSFGAWFLRRYYEEAGLSRDFSIYNDDDSLALLRRAEPRLSAQQAAAVMRKIDSAKNYCLDSDSAELNFGPDFPKLYESYTRRLRDTGNADFGDLIMLPLKVLRENPAIREEMRRRFRVILVDEYQDSNIAQFKLLKALYGDGTYLCVVGDDDQSIYRFRGAEVSNILSFTESFPGAEIIRLESNYRSTPEILTAASAVVSHNEGRLGKTLKAVRLAGKKPVLAFLQDSRAEAEYCAELVLNALAKDTPYSDWAILYRTNAQSFSFESEFVRRGIPYTVVGSLKFYEREEVKTSVSLLSLILNGRDEIAFSRIMEKTGTGVGKASLDKIRGEFERIVLNNEGSADFLDAAEKTLGSLHSKKAKDAVSSLIGAVREARQFLDTAESAAAAKIAEDAENDGAGNDDSSGALSAFVDFALKKAGLYEFYHAEDEATGSTRELNLNSLVNAAAAFPFSHSGLTDFLERIRLDRESAEDAAASKEGEQAANAKAGRVTLITLHNTKGLEFPRVIITGLESGLFPRDDKTGEDLEEERRLMYVGCTRAMDRLYFTSCTYRMLYGKIYPSYPSMFLREIPLDGMKVIGNPPPGFLPLRGAVHKSSSTMANVPAVKQALAEKWKKGATVFHDDYGYGIITEASFSGSRSNNSDDSQYVISVRFGTGGEKKFLPEYQANSLLIIKDEN